MPERREYLKQTPVRESIDAAVGSLDHIEINTSQVYSVAEEWANEEFELPSWRAPVFPDETAVGTTADDVIDFFFVGNSINFAFRNFETDQKFVTEYNDVEWGGSFGMWACLKRAYEDDVPILDGEYLSQLTRSELEYLFEPADGQRIPMLDQRLRILNAIGDRLVTDYDGRFHNFVNSAGNQLFNDGDGIVEQLVEEFPSFDDTHYLETETRGLRVHLYKRAQLAPGMSYGRFNQSDSFTVTDPEGFTVFADYNLPNVLRYKGILEYDDHLDHLVSSQTLLEAGSREELEIRIATVAAGDQLMQELNDRREKPVYGPHIDYKLFSVRDNVDTPIHKTKTTDY
jgi:hypothetical protein